MNGYDRMLRCGIVGCGTMGTLRGRALRQVGVCELVGVNDTDAAAAGRLAQQLQCQARSFDDLCRHAADLLFICTPTDTHHDLIAAAAGQVPVIFCEYPLAGTRSEAAALYDLCAKRGSRLYVGSVRVLPAFAAARDACADGTIGAPQMLRLTLLSPGQADEDVFTELASAALDYAGWVLGDIQRLFAQSSRDGTLGMLLTARCAGGRLAHLELNAAPPQNSSAYTYLEIAGDGGVLTFDSHEDTAVSVFTSHRVAALHPPYLPTPSGSLAPFVTECTAVADALDGQPAPHVPSKGDVLTRLDAVAAMHRSIATGGPQSLGHTDGERT